MLPKIFKISKYVIETKDWYILDSRVKSLPKPIGDNFNLKQYLSQEGIDVISMEATEFHFNYVDKKNQICVSSTNNIQ